MGSLHLEEDDTKVVQWSPISRWRTLDDTRVYRQQALNPEVKRASDKQCKQTRVSSVRSFQSDEVQR